MDFDVEDWDDEFGFTDDDSGSVVSSLPAAPNRIVGICAEKFVDSNPENKWDDDFAFDKSDGSGGLFGGNQILKAGEDKKGDSTTNDVTDLDDWEDWDAELGIDTEPKEAQILPSLMNVSVQSSQHLDTGILPSRYTLLQEKSDLVIVKFPKLPLLYRLKEKEGHRLFLTEDEFCKWITNLLQEPLVTVRSPTPFSQLKSEFYEQKIGQKPFSIAWIDSHVVYLSELLRTGENEVAWETIVQFFTEIQLSQLESIKEENINGIIDQFLIFVLQIACKLWTSDEDDSFISDIIKKMKQLRPKLIDQIDLMQAECYAHHLEGSDFMDKKPLVMFTDLYCKQRKQDSVSALQLRAQILIDVHLYSRCYSPLTTSKMDVDPETIQEEIVRLRRVRGMEVEDLFTSELRISTLTDIYSKIKSGFFKAKAAYVLALVDEFEYKNHQGAERKYLESLYILHTTVAFSKRLYLIVTELGSNVLSSFASELEFQSKYKYAIQTYHACGQVLQLRGCSKDYFTLLRKMAHCSKEFDDHSLSLLYYKELLRHYIEEKKVNEIIYVSEILSKTFADVGRFDIAEEYLLGAYSKLTRKQRVTSNPSTFTLLLNLGKLYLRGFFYERGIHLLEHLLQSPQPRGKENLIVSALARGYITKRNFQACHNLLEEKSNDKKDFMRHKRNRSTGRGSNNFINPNSSTGTMFGSLSKKNTSFFDLAARNYLYEHRYIDAINSIDKAITMCAKSNFNALGNYFYLRGKIFQAICSPEEVIKYPIQLSQDHSYKSDGDVLQECISCFRKAYRYFCAIGDDIRETKSLTRISETYLDYLFTPVMLQHQDLSTICKFDYFESSNILLKPGVEHIALRNGEFFEITIDMIETPANIALDTATEFSIPILSIQGFLNMAEINLLKNQKETSYAFWEEASKNLLDLWIIPFVGRYSRPGWLIRIHRLVKRVIRILFCFEKDIIDKNLIFLDANNILELAIEQSKKQSPIPQFEQDIANSGNANSLLQLVNIHNEKVTKRSLTDPARNAKEREILKKIKKAQRKRQLSSSRLSTTVRSFFDDKEGIDWSCISPPIEEDLELSQQSYGALYCISTLLDKYSSRKQSLVKQQIFNKNQKQLRVLLKCSNKLREFSLFNPLLKDPNEQQTNDLSFSKITEKCDGISRLLYIIYIDGCALSYSPSLSSSTDSLKVQKIIRPRNSLELEATSRSEFRNSIGDRNKFIVQISSLLNESEYASFEVKPTVTLEELISFVCDIGQWCPNYSSSSDDHKSKSASYTLRSNLRSMKNSSKVLKFPIKPIDSSKCIGEELSALIETTNTTSLFSLPKTELLFGVKIQQADEIHFIPLSGSKKAQIQHLFPTGPTLVNLILYASSYSPSVTELDTRSQISIGQTLKLSSEMVQMLQKLSISKFDKTLDDQYMKRVIDDITACLQGLVKDSIPPPQFDDKSKNEISKNPLLLCCAPSLQIFPWEIAIGDTTIRNLSFCNILHREKFRRTVLSSYEVTPVFITFVYSSYDRTTQNIEDERRRTAVENCFKRLCLSPVHGAPQYQVPSILPLHSPIKRKRGDKNLLCINEERLVKSASYIVDYLESQPETQYNIVIISYTNIVEMNETTGYLMSCACNATIIYVPRSHLKEAIQRLTKTCTESTSTTIYQTIMSHVIEMQNELQIPIAVFNLP